MAMVTFLLKGAEVPPSHLFSVVGESVSLYQMEGAVALLLCRNFCAQVEAAEAVEEEERQEGAVEPPSSYAEVVAVVAAAAACRQVAAGVLLVPQHWKSCVGEKLKKFLTGEEVEKVLLRVLELGLVPGSVLSVVMALVARELGLGLGLVHQL